MYTKRETNDTTNIVFSGDSGVYCSFGRATDLANHQQKKGEQLTKVG